VFQAKVVETVKTHIFCFITFSKNRAFYGIMWKNIVKSDMPQMTVHRMLIAWWIPRATYTHSVCVIFTASPLQQ